MVDWFHSFLFTTFPILSSSPSLSPLFCPPLSSTVFAELMESMEQWYMSGALEADYYRTKRQANSNRKMQHDPRTQKPFEQIAVSGVRVRLLSFSGEVNMHHLICSFLFVPLMFPCRTLPLAESWRRFIRSC